MCAEYNEQKHHLENPVIPSRMLTTLRQYGAGMVRNKDEISLGGSCVARDVPEVIVLQPCNRAFFGAVLRWADASPCSDTKASPPLGPPVPPYC